ncbi:PR-1-like protein [Zopfia rhizophila CBS 207.26]|uniref:PR-1-like protein n=1 Tax=Zopfia rhizophila CBS 207.26 TaxID=1314779 RepID=A0A6A6DX50_9PEZI|nr:PR-1-like protein [Zopfia rhizophila CBS 207.26]
MRSTFLLTSALAVGALAGPINKRYMVTEYDVDVETVTVYVTAAASSKPAPAPSSQYTPPPAQTPTPTPTPEYTPPPASSKVQSSQAPASSAPASGEHKSGEAQAKLSSGPDYQAMVLYHHNAARANHDASPLTWDTACEQNAKKAAETCIFKHDIPEGAGQGQNLFTLSGDSFNVSAGITESWYKGEFEPMQPYWGKDDIPDSVFHSVGHLTQMLWKDTTKVGCFSADCSGKMFVPDESGNLKSSEMDKYTVCNYAAAGNVAGGYAKNVAAPISTTNLGSWSD